MSDASCGGRAARRLIPSFVRPVVALAGLVTFVGCDPFYTIGARVKLGPPAPDSCVLASLRRAFGRGPFESIDTRRSSYTPIRVADSADFWTGNSRLSMEPQKGSILLLEVTTSWWGPPSKVPMPQQHAFVASATAMLQRIQTACEPTSSDAVECVAGGWGRDTVCRGT